MYLQQPTRCSRKYQHTLGNPKKVQKTIRYSKQFRRLQIKSSEKLSHPLFGPFGTIIGNTIPITPKIAEKMIIGNIEAPIFNDLQQDFIKIVFLENIFQY